VRGPDRAPKAKNVVAPLGASSLDNHGAGLAVPILVIWSSPGSVETLIYPGSGGVGFLESSGSHGPMHSPARSARVGADSTT